MLKKWLHLFSTRGLSYFTLWYLYAQTLIQLLQVNQFVGSTLDICQPHCNIERLWMPHWTWPSTAASVHPPGDIVSCFVTSHDTVWHCWVANYQIGPSHFFCKFLGNVSSCTLLLIIILLSSAVLASFWSKSEPEHIGEVRPVLIILKCICKRRQRAKQPCRSFKFWSSSFIKFSSIIKTHTVYGSHARLQCLLGSPTANQVDFLFNSDQKRDFASK